MIELLLVLTLPLIGAAILALWGHRPWAGEANASLSLLTLLAAAALTAHVISFGPQTVLGELFFVDAFNVAAPLADLSSSIARGTLGIALACVLMSFLMMITRSKAVPQVIGFLAMENGLFFAATSATYGMPMVVELGIALDVLVGTFIFGIFFFQIRETFDSLDIHHLEKLKEK
jgi:hydrogenase-4 component E